MAGAPVSNGGWFAIRKDGRLKSSLVFEPSKSWLLQILAPLSPFIAGRREKAGGAFDVLPGSPHTWTPEIVRCLPAFQCCPPLHHSIGRVPLAQHSPSMLLAFPKPLTDRLPGALYPFANDLLQALQPCVGCLIGKPMSYPLGFYYGDISLPGTCNCCGYL